MEPGILSLNGAGIARRTRSNVKCCQALDVVVNLYDAIRYLIGIWVDLADKCCARQSCHGVKQDAAVVPKQLGIIHMIELQDLATYGL